jgi:two-component system alkaline phosphatase synthesis response regulator PhoP
VTKVAIVEDDTEIRELLEFAVAHSGFDVVSAGNGKRGLDIIIRERPRVVILDVMMPGMSGFAVCRAVKQLMGPRAPYIIMLTAKVQPADVSAGHAHGADLYLIKPVDTNKLLNHIKDAVDNTATESV